MKRRISVPVIIAVLVVIAWVGYLSLSPGEPSRLAWLPGADSLIQAVAQGTAGGEVNETEQGEIAQAVARLGDLTVSTSVAGKLAARTAVDLGFQESGFLLEVLVREGETVRVGDLLARLKTDQSPEELAAGIAEAELAVAQAQRTLETLRENAEVKAANILRTLEEAHQTLEALQDNSLQLASAQQTLATARAAVAEAQTQLTILTAAPTQEAKEIAYASLLFKEKELKESEKEIERIADQIKRTSDKSARERLSQQLLSLQIRYSHVQRDYEQRKYQYEYMDDPPDPIALALAEAQLATARAQLAQAEAEWVSAQAGASPGELALAEVRLREAQTAWENQRDSSKSYEIQLAELALEVAQAQLALARSKKLTLELVAPFDGVVLAIHTHAGNRIEKKLVLTLGDLSQPVLEVSADESELGFIQPGNKAEIIFDAFPNTTFSGKVLQVDPGLVEEDGIKSIHALVSLDTTPTGNSFPFLVGLNATVDIIAAETHDAVLVPLEALRELSRGEFAVYVVKGDELELRPVIPGIQDYTTVEILDGLTAGEVVALGDISTTEGSQ